MKYSYGIRPAFERSPSKNPLVGESLKASHYRPRIDPPRYRPDGHGLARERDDEVARIGLGSEPSLVAGQFQDGEHPVMDAR